MPSTCNIFFDRPNAVYYGGDELIGRLELTTTSSKSIRGIHVNVIGIINVKWEEDRPRNESNNPHYYSVVFKGKDTIFSSKTYIVGSASARTFELMPGTYNHEFNCLLPTTLLSTFSGEHGTIKYKVIVTIERPTFKFDNVFEQEFKVFEVFDLNSNTLIYRQPKSATDKVAYQCCSCCLGRIGKIQATISTLYYGYAQEEQIHYKLFVENESSGIIDGGYLTLEQKITYSAGFPESRHKREYSEIDIRRIDNKILKYSTKEIKDYVAVPWDLLPTSTLKNICIQVEYRIVVKLRTGPGMSDLKFKMPIVIGTIPLIKDENNDIIRHQPTAPQNESVYSTGSDVTLGYNQVILRQNQGEDIHRTNPGFITKY